MSTEQSWLPAEFVYPATHAQVYKFTRSVHVAPFKHWPDAHSSMSVEQCAPEYPAAQVHVYSNKKSVHVAPF